VDQIDFKIKPYIEYQIVERLYNCEKVTNIIMQIVNIFEMDEGNEMVVHIVDPWDPFRRVYENLYVNNEQDMAICKQSIYIKLLDYNYKLNMKSKCTYLCVDGSGSYRHVVDLAENNFEDK
jgi:hypothetical protein